MSCTPATRRDPGAVSRSIGRPRRAVLTVGVCLLLLLASFGAAATNVGAVDPLEPARATGAIDWLDGELDTNGGTLPGFTPGSTDWGLTADAVLAHVAAGRGGDASAQTATDRLAGALSTYTTFDPDVAGVRIAGATAKVLLVLSSQGRDTTDVGGVGGSGGLDLDAELRSLMVTTGSHDGRFADRVPDPTWDASNGFGQALAVLALARTSAGVPDEAVGYLLTQQCPAGGFRLSYSPLAESAVGCTTDAGADSDSTALAVQALLSTSRTSNSAEALGRAVSWLIARQDPWTGGFGGSGPTATVNANSTGVIAQALRAAGQIEAADVAARWITSSLQLTTGPDAGAIAYDADGYTDAVANGITTGTSDQWRRTTSQAVLALGLAPYSPVVGSPVGLPSTAVPTSTAPNTGPPTTAPSTTASSASVPVSVSPATVAPGGAVPAVGLGAAAGSVGARNGSTSVGSASGGTSSGTERSAGSAGARLASTGSGSTVPLWLGAGLTALGCLTAGTASLVTRRRASA